jgi:hypothetical protein
MNHKIFNSDGNELGLIGEGPLVDPRVKVTVWIGYARMSALVADSQ